MRDQLRARLPLVLVVHGTRKFLDRVSGPISAAVDESTTTLGDWYAAVRFWKPQVALFVNESTLLPVVVPFAPGATVVDRFPASAATVFRALGVSDAFVEREVAEMSEHRLASTRHRSVVGVMNEFARPSEYSPASKGERDLVALSLWLAQTPSSPLYGRHVSPDRELVAIAAQHSV